MHTDEQQTAYEAELISRYGDAARADIKRSRAKWDSMSTGEQQQVQDDVAALEHALAAQMAKGVAPEDVDTLRPLLDAHRGWVTTMWNKPCSLQAYAGLAELYASHDDFRARYEAVAPGFTDWFVAAMKAYAN